MDDLIDQTVTSQISEIADFEKEQIIFCQNIDITNSKDKPSQVALLLTECQIRVFKKKSMFKKNYLLKSQFPLYQLISINYTDPDQFSLTFTQSKIQMFGQNAYTCVSLLYHHLLEVRIADDMPIIQFDPNTLPTIPQQIDNIREKDRLLIKRLRFKAFEYNEILPQDFFNTITKYFYRMNLFEDIDTTFDFRNLLGYPKSFDAVLYCLIDKPSIRTLILPQNPHKTHWKSLGTLLKYNANITEIETMEQPDETIKDFIDMIVSNKNLKLSRLRFRSAEYDEHFVSYLTSLIQHIPTLVHLAIEDAMTQRGLTEFIDNFNTCAEYERITTLSLSGTTNIDVSKLIRFAPNIKSLDLCRCDLDISSILPYFAKSQIEVLNLSENKAVEEIDNNTQIPPTLSKLIVSNVDWQNQMNYINFLKVISVSQEKMKNGSLYLDISNIHVTDDVDVTISAMKFLSFSRLSVLIFNGNTINENFLAFLEKCKSISTLSVTDCFTNCGPVFLHFCQILKETTTLSQFIIRATKDHFTLEMTKTLFEALKFNKSIKILDFQDQHQGLPLYEFIKQLILENMTLQEIKFDNNSLPSLECLNSLLEASKYRSIPIKFEVPKRDILSKKCTDVQISKIILHFQENNMNFEINAPEQIPPELINPQAQDHAKNSQSVESNQNESPSKDKIVRFVNDPNAVFDFSSIEQKFINDDQWIQSSNCVPIRDVSKFAELVSHDLSIERLVHQLITNDKK